MHYYQFHVSDYLHDTAHLTPDEDIVYRRLLDLYYTSERPIPNETQAVARRIRMPKQAEIVGAILQEFFALQNSDNSWHHKRCDELIAAYQSKSQANQRNGAKGGRPKRNPSETQSVTQSEPSRNLNQEPITNNHKPVLRTKKATSVAAPDGVSLSVWEGFLAIRKARRSPLTDAALEGIRRQADLAGWSLEKALAECNARGWQSFKSEWVAQGSGQKAAQTAANAVLSGLTRGFLGVDRE
jgi:uncharacterized protein YdaU (DUF1376 family)